MEDLIINEGRRVPGVQFMAKTGELRLSGRSIPENALEMFSPLIEWLDRYIKEPAPQTSFEFRLVYFNSSSAEYILEILRRLEALHLSGKKVSLNWYYDTDDEDMQQIGEDFKSMLKIPIEMTENEVEEEE